MRRGEGEGRGGGGTVGTGGRAGEGDSRAPAARAEVAPPDGGGYRDCFETRIPCGKRGKYPVPDSPACPRPTRVPGYTPKAEKFSPRPAWLALIRFVLRLAPPGTGFPTPPGGAPGSRLTAVPKKFPRKPRVRRYIRRSFCDSVPFVRRAQYSAFPFSAPYRATEKHPASSPGADCSRRGLPAAPGFPPKKRKPPRRPTDGGEICFDITARKRATPAPEPHGKNSGSRNPETGTPGIL